MTNSVVPMANALSVSANRAMGMDNTPWRKGPQCCALIDAEKAVYLH
jgi:hypothetical protein